MGSLDSAAAAHETCPTLSEPHAWVVCLECIHKGMHVMCREGVEKGMTFQFPRMQVHATVGVEDKGEFTNLVLNV